MATKLWPPTPVAATCPECGNDFVYADSLPSIYILWCPHCDYGSYDRKRFVAARWAGSRDNPIVIDEGEGEEGDE